MNATISPIFSEIMFLICDNDSIFTFFSHNLHIKPQHSEICLNIVETFPLNWFKIWQNSAALLFGFIATKAKVLTKHNYASEVSANYIQGLLLTIIVTPTEL